MNPPPFEPPATTAPVLVDGLRLRPGRVLRLLLTASAVLVLLHAATGLVALVTGESWALDLYALFNLGTEQNFPTHFTASLWALAALLCWTNSRVPSSTTARARHRWQGIGLVSLMISIDEIAMLHERLSEPLRTALGTGGALHFAWILPYSILALGVALVFGRFVLGLTSRVRTFIFLSGVVYVSGALGFELLEGHILYAESGAGEGLLYRASYTMEETLELLGVSLFVYALLLQLDIGLRGRESDGSGARER